MQDCGAEHFSYSVCDCPKRLTPSVAISIDGGPTITVTDNIAYGERNEAQANIFGFFSRKPERVEADIYFEHSDGDSWTLRFTPFMLPFINAVTQETYVAYVANTTMIDEYHFKTVFSLESGAHADTIIPQESRRDDFALSWVFDSSLHPSDFGTLFSLAQTV